MGDETKNARLNKVKVFNQKEMRAMSKIIRFSATTLFFLTVVFALRSTVLADPFKLPYLDLQCNNGGAGLAKIDVAEYNSFVADSETNWIKQNGWKLGNPIPQTITGSGVFSDRQTYTYSFNTATGALNAFRMVSYENSATSYSYTLGWNNNTVNALTEMETAYFSPYNGHGGEGLVTTENEKYSYPDYQMIN